MSRERGMRPVVVGGDPLVGVCVDGRYRMTRRIAIGGMGCVYEADDLRDERRVALKTLRPCFAARPGLVRRFEREVRALGRIRSPFVAESGGQGRLSDGRPYFVMEYVVGRSVARALLDAKGPLETGFAVSIARQVASALEAAHAVHVIHRDLKAENVLLRTDDASGPSVKLLDFGLAKIMDSHVDDTGRGIALGTPGYMAPEQVRGQPVDERSDVYGCGLLLYEMLTGRLPFDGDDAFERMRATTEHHAPLPSSLEPPIAVPPRIESVVLGCLYLDPGRRFQTMTALRVELDRVAGAPRLRRGEISDDRSRPPHP